MNALIETDQMERDAATIGLLIIAGSRLYMRFGGTSTDDLADGIVLALVEGIAMVGIYLGYRMFVAFISPTVGIYLLGIATCHPFRPHPRVSDLITRKAGAGVAAYHRNSSLSAHRC